MEFEALYADLLAIASHLGPLDRTAVERATALLALPRYASATDPHAQLVKDIEGVIERIPPGPLPGSPTPKDNAGTLDYKSHARLFFSLEQPGTYLTERRKVKGGATRWQTPAIIYRVLLGLVSLPSSSDSGEEEYEIDWVRMSSHRSKRSARRSWQSPKSGVEIGLHFRLFLSSPGPHCAWIPLPAPVELRDVDMERREGVQEPQLVLVGDQPLLLFGVGQQADDDIACSVTYFQDASDSTPFETPADYLEFSVTKTIGGLSIGLVERDDGRYRAAGRAPDGTIRNVVDTTRADFDFGQPPVGYTCIFGTAAAFEARGVRASSLTT